ncbi:MAG TPA: hypothetical protein VF516_23210 [Kofleriaceae bacterium]
MSNKELFDAVAGALRQAGYTQIAVHDSANESFITATKGPGGAYFRVVQESKPRVAGRTTAGGPEPQPAPHDAHVVPAVAELHHHLRQNPQTAAAFGIPAEAMKHIS